MPIAKRHHPPGYGRSSRGPDSAAGLRPHRASTGPAPKSVVVHGIGVERPQVNRIGPPFHLHPGHKSCLGIGLPDAGHDAAYKAIPPAAGIPPRRGFHGLKKILPYAETIYHRSSPDARKQPRHHEMGYGPVSPGGATAPPSEAAGGGNAAKANRQTPQAIFRPAAVDQKRQSLPTRSRRSGKRPGFSPPRGVCSGHRSPPSVRHHRRGSVLAAASHKSSAAVSSDAAGSNGVFPPGTGTSASGAAKATATPHFSSKSER